MSAMLTPEQLRKVAKIIEDLSAMPNIKTPAPLGDNTPILGARLPIEAEGVLLGYALDDIGGCYMFTQEGPSAHE